MSAESNSQSGAEDLQFDRAIDPDSSAPTGTPVCAKCNAAIRMYYYHVDGETVCSSCKQVAERAHDGGKSRGGMMKASLFGVGAALAGAIIYYSVMEYMNVEIGIVAILIGFMVGYAVRSASGRGGRRFQILAAGLTYFAVALAYAPFAIRGMTEGDEEEVTADSTATGTPTAASADDAAPSQIATSDVDADVASDTSSATDAPEKLGLGGFALGLAGGLLFILALPVVAVFGTMPSGLISALIIGIGMHQAWSMTRASQASITGPFKVGNDPAAAAA